MRAISATSLALLVLSGQDPAPFKAYQNYDFVPGQNVVFEDDFRVDTDGEFPAHWDLSKGQAVVNKIGGVPAFLLTDGNYVVVKPVIKAPKYLSDPFTVEFDYLVKSGGSPVVLMLVDGEGNEHHLVFERGVSTGYFENDLAGSEIIPDDAFNDKWHHAAVVYRGGQLKAYLDAGRSLVVPKVGFVPVSLQFAGIGTPETPIILTNIRVAAGGDMNPLNQVTTTGKYVARGVKFDFDSAKLKPESMGELNAFAALMKQNAALKFEVGGHTDGDGDAAHNLKLSQDRADAVKRVLVGLGVDAARLTTKGYGSTKPIAANSTPEGKANNRRVEFVKTV